MKEAKPYYTIMKAHIIKSPLIVITFIDQIGRAKESCCYKKTGSWKDYLSKYLALIL